MVIEKSRPESLKLIVQYLQRGEVVLLPCDTIYGFVGMVDLSLEKLNALKGRNGEKHFIQLVTFEMASQISRDPIDETIRALWPGPLTLIVNDRFGGTTAIRVPADPYLISIIEEVESPLYTTSANRAGEPFLNTFEEIYELFSSEIPLFVKGDKLSEALPSTILDMSGDRYKIVRQGALDISELISNI